MQLAQRRTSQTPRPPPPHRASPQSPSAGWPWQEPAAGAPSAAPHHRLAAMLSPPGCTDGRYLPPLPSTAEARLLAECCCIEGWLWQQPCLRQEHDITTHCVHRATCSACALFPLAKKGQKRQQNGAQSLPRLLRRPLQEVKVCALCQELPESLPCDVLSMKPGGKVLSADSLTRQSCTLRVQQDIGPSARLVALLPFISYCF